MESKASVACVSANINNHKFVHPAIPVKVKIFGGTYTIATNMGMDPYSTGVFTCENLLQHLSIKGQTRY